MYAHHATRHSVLLLDFVLNSTHAIQSKSTYIPYNTLIPTSPPPIFLLCTLHYLTTKQQRERFATQHNNILRNFIRNVIQEGLSSLFFFSPFLLLLLAGQIKCLYIRNNIDRKYTRYLCVFLKFFLACVMQLR